MRTAVLASLLLALAVTGCASTRAMPDAARAALYRAHAGEPVDTFPYMRPLTDWAPLDRHGLAVWTSPTRAWLLEVSDCPDLEWAHAISVSNNVGRVSARFDQVTPLGTGRSIPCRIEQIRPLDVKAIREAERAARR